MRNHKKWITFIAVFLLILSMTACGSGKEEETYHISQMVQEMSDGSVTRTEYRYTEDWATEEVLTYQNEQMMTRMYYTFGEDGKPETMSITDGNTTESVDLFFTYDEEGRVLSQTHSMNGQVQYYSEVTYDDKGNILTQYTEQPTYGNSLQITYTYDESGNQTEMRTLLNGIHLTRKVTEYDASGHITVETEYQGEDQISAVSNHSYDAETRTDTALTYDAYGNEGGKIITSYDEAGNEIMKEYYMNNTLTVRMTMTYVKG